jgi:hemerythrin-like domain-containing protein
MLLKIGQRPDHGFNEPLGLLSDCHRRIERFLAILAAITRDAAGGPLSAAQQTQLRAALEYFATAAPRHTADEEESLFPRLKQAASTDADHVLHVLARLEHDHSLAGDHHRRVDALVRRWLGDGSLGHAEVGDLAGRVAALNDLYRAHIAVEDGELFPIAARALSAEQLSAVGDEMAARRGQHADNRAK